MTDREKVIKGLECCLGKGQKRGMCEDCPYDTNAGRMKCNLGDMHVDALALLKAQEPRVMTLDEYKALAEKPKEERDPVWEEWHGLRSTWAIPNQAYGGYGTSWRCWTSRPDQATREATPWN